MVNQKKDPGRGPEIGVTEGVRRTSGVTPISDGFHPPDPEVPEKKRRRRFTAQYKLRILEEAEACTTAGPDRGPASPRGPVFFKPDQMAAPA